MKKHKTYLKKLREKEVKKKQMIEYVRQKNNRQRRLPAK